MRVAFVLAVLLFSLPLVADPMCSKDDELCRLLVQRRARVVSTSAAAIVTTPAPVEIPCTPPGTSRTPCTPPDTYTSSASPSPLSVATTFGGTIMVLGQAYWRWVKKVEPTSACTTAQKSDKGSYQYACAAKVGDALWLTPAFRMGVP